MRRASSRSAPSSGPNAKSISTRPRHAEAGHRDDVALHLVGAAAEGEDERGAVHALDARSEEHTSELQSRLHLVCRLLLEKKNSDPHARTWVTGTSNHANISPPISNPPLPSMPDIPYGTNIAYALTQT